MRDNLTVNWPKIQPPEYQFTDCINIRTSPNGARLDVMVGYVRERPGKKNVVLSSTWIGQGGQWQQKTFYVKTPSDWARIDEAVKNLWPEVDGAGTADEIKNAVRKIATEKKLLDLLSAHPELANSLPENLDLLTLEPPEKEAIINLLKAGGDISIRTLELLSQEPVDDLSVFSKNLQEYRLATINSLVTHIIGRLSFIDTFEKAIHNEATYERRGDDSIHNLLKQNIWLVDPNYLILQDDTTLKTIIYENYKKTYIGEAAGKRPDFLCMTEIIPTRDFLTIIEIKRPSVSLTFEMVKQVLEYRQILSQHSEKKYNDFHCLLIGKEIDPLLKANDLSGSKVLVKTYTDFIGEARRYYSEYLKLVKENPFSV